MRYPLVLVSAVYLLRCQRVRQAANAEHGLKSSDGDHGIPAASGVNFKGGWPLFFIGKSRLALVEQG
jgi:hypothetical protein